MYQRIFLILFLSLLVSGIIALFWIHEIKYLRPTLVPQSYAAVMPGAKIKNPSIEEGKIYFLHFYNPDCPCSRFNARHVKSLLRSYSETAIMKIVVTDQESLIKAQREFEGQSFLVDSKNELAKACGVYSTPQAVIVDQKATLYYRGNYNRSRYCTSKATNFAELALISLMNGQPSPSFGLLATQSYGCEWDEKEKEFVFF